MAKALKTIGAIAVVAGLAVVTGGAALGLGVSLGTTIIGTGISAGTLILAGGALQAIGTSLQKMPEVPASQIDRLNASVDTAAHRKTALGSTALATDIRYLEWFGNDQERCGWIVAHASHRIHSIDEIWLNDELAWTATGGTQGKFINYFFVRRVVLEGSAANAFSFGSGKWNAATSRLTGCAYSQWEFKVTGDSKKTESPFASGIPTRVTVIGKGALVYDPRRDSTVPGGSGPMRAADQATWRFVADDGATIGDNLALQVLRVLLGWKIAGKLAVGCGVPVRRLGLPSFAVAANQCDEPVNRSAGGNEPRYQGAIVLSEDMDPRAMLDPLLAACSARFRDHGGKLQIAIMHNDLAGAATDPGLDEDDVVGAFTWDPDPALEQTPNIVRGRYTDPASLYQLVPYPDVAFPSFDGIDRVLPLDLAAIESPSQAQRVVKQFLQRKQYARRFSAPFDITAWRYNVGDLVPFTFAPLSFDRKVFRVVETDPGSNPCQMVLEEESAAIYAWDADDRAPVVPAVPTIYDAGNNPLIRAIDEAAGTATWDGVTGPGKPDDNADVTGDNTAKDTLAVGGRSAEDVLGDIEINAQGILSEALRQDDLLLIFDARTLVEGQPVGPTFLDFKTSQNDLNGFIASNFSLLGAKSEDGTAWNLALDTAKVAPNKTLAQRFEEIGAITDGASVSVQQLEEVFIGDGQSYAKALLRADADGVFGAFSLTADGVERLARISMVADELEFVDPNKGNPIKPFSIIGGKVRAIDFEADTITYGALVERFSEAGQQSLDPNGWYQRLPGGVIMQGGRWRSSISREVSLSVLFPIPFPNQVLSVGVVPYLNNFSAFRDLWLQLLGNASLSGFSCQTQAATSDNMTLDGFDWWAWGR